MILDTFNFTTNKWINGLVGYSSPAYYIDVIEDVNDRVRFYHGSKHTDYSRTRISKKQVQKFFDEGKLPNEIKKYL